MSRPRRIVIDPIRLQELIERVKKKEMTLKAVAAELGVSQCTIRKRARELGIRKPRRRSKYPLHVRLQKKFTVEELQQLSQCEIAEKMGCAQPQVNKAFKELGIKSDYHNRCKEKTQAEIEQVIDYIQSHGGRVAPTIRKLGLKVDRIKVYKYCKDNHIDLSIYVFAYRRHGNWLTLPGHAERYQKSDHILDARCGCCGDVYRVQLINLVSGASTRCQACSKGHRGSIKVRCKETGKVFRSIGSWAKSIEGQGSYQTLRLKISKTGSCCIDELTYHLIDY